MSENYKSNTIFVGGISWKADEASLTNFFSSFGVVVDCKIIVDRETSKSKGYGFVTFSDVAVAQTVKTQKDLTFLGKAMNVGDAYRKNAAQTSTQNTNSFAYPMQWQPYGNYMPMPYAYMPPWSNGYDMGYNPNYYVSQGYYGEPAPSYWNTAYNGGGSSPPSTSTDIATEMSHVSVGNEEGDHASAILEETTKQLADVDLNENQD